MATAPVVRFRVNGRRKVRTVAADAQTWEAAVVAACRVERVKPLRASGTLTKRGYAVAQRLAAERAREPTTELVVVTKPCVLFGCFHMYERGREYDVILPELLQYDPMLGNDDWHLFNLSPYTATSKGEIASRHMVLEWRPTGWVVRLLCDNAYTAVKHVNGAPQVRLERRGQEEPVAAGDMIILRDVIVGIQ